MDHQIAKRTAEGYIINFAIDSMSKTDVLKVSKSTYKGIGKNSHISNMTAEKYGDYTFQDKNKHPLAYERRVMDTISDFIHQNYFSLPECNNYIEVQLFTEYKTDDNIFRAHPNYRDKGPWHDWVLVRWIGNARRHQSFRFAKEDHKRLQIDFGDNVPGKDNYCYSPAQLLCFFQLEDDLHAVGLCCEYKCKRSSVFSTQWQLRNQIENQVLTVIPVDSIVRHCCIFPEYIENDGLVFHEIWNTELWADEFFRI